MEKNVVMELGVVFIVVVGIADVSGSRQRHRWGSYYLNKKKISSEKKKKKEKMVPLFQVVMCHCHHHCRSDYYSTSELVIYKNKNRKKPSFEAGHMASAGGCVLKCMGRYRAIIGGNTD